jgi:DNA-binding XRE family transcriptional regulator
MSVQVINLNGQPEYAVLPYADYQRLLEQAEMLEDVEAYDNARADLASGKEELIPSNVALSLVRGDNPIRVWREYRKLTQIQLAKEAGITDSFLSQIEAGKRKASVGVLSAIASALKLDVDDILR